MKRVFISIPLTEVVRRQLRDLIGVLKVKMAGVHWVDPRQAHVTLRFIGEVEKSELIALSDIVSKCTADVRPFKLEIQEFEFLPSAKRARVVALSVMENVLLDSLTAALSTRLEAFGLVPLDVQPFRPHVTIGRTRAGVLNAVQYSLIHFSATCPVHTIDIMKSTLTTDGPVYTLVKQIFI